MLSKLFVASIILLSSLGLSAKGYQDQFEELLNNINSLHSKDYTASILRMKKKMDSLFEKKKGVCIGEYSEDIFSENEISEQQGKEVEKQSKNACFLELKEDLDLYYKAIYRQRKNFFIFSHKIQLKKLDSDYTKLSDSLKVEIKTLKKRVERERTR